ncbi:alpha/beta fold hydrolase [Blattabacterium cuenoti]|uniref:Alpha/beta fold family hydrolase n=1 Tax=Blattabacterium cuenoti STAT TaxID=1457030 RepID=A0A224ALD6_9FLAO|nr:alpha/beta fold hydrolase [Blattabacterium cuenoti]BBA17520.1 alpha/beta fold family hydrolase [Blattabacterium cuenoti STAT]
MILHSNIYGSGSSILVFHGLFGNGENWVSFARKFENNYQVHLLDIRNHGKSFFSEKMNYDLISKDILEYIYYHKLNHPILLGHSMGGRAVMRFSIKYPKIPKKIIIVDISPKGRINNQKKLIHILKKVNFNIINTKKDLDFFLKKWISDLKIRSFFSYKCTKKQKNGKLCFHFSLLNIEKNYDSLIYEEIKNGSYYGPTLFLRGEYSNFILDKDYNYTRTLFPKSKIWIVKKSNHWIHIDNPMDFYKKISIFLNET